MAETIKMGDTVMLKSGGPVITAQNDDENPLYSWFDDNLVLRYARFNPATLKKVALPEYPPKRP